MDEEAVFLQFDKSTGTWGIKSDPYATIEFATKEDYDRFLEMVDFWNEHHKN